MIPRHNLDLETLINEMTPAELEAAEQTFKHLLNLIQQRRAEPPTLIVLKLPELTDTQDRWQQN